MAEVEGKGVLTEEDEPVAWAAVFSESLGKAVEINDAERPVDPRTRTVRTFPCAKEGDTYTLKPPKRRQGFLVWWQFSDGASIGSSFNDSEDLDRQVAIDNLLEVLTAPDAEIVPFREVFMRRLK